MADCERRKYYVGYIRLLLSGCLYTSKHDFDIVSLKYTFKIIKMYIFNLLKSYKSVLQAMQSGGVLRSLKIRHKNRKIVIRHKRLSRRKQSRIDIDLFIQNFYQILIPNIVIHSEKSWSAWTCWRGACI